MVASLQAPFSPFTGALVAQVRSEMTAKKTKNEVEARAASTSSVAVHSSLAKKIHKQLFGRCGSLGVWLLVAHLSDPYSRCCLSCPCVCLHNSISTVSAAGTVVEQVGNSVERFLPGRMTLEFSRSYGDRDVRLGDNGLPGW